MTKLGGAGIVDQSSKSINTAGQNAVRQNVHLHFVGIKSIKPAGTADVYNMEVETHHNFVVNGGIVVHNCLDALRYLAMHGKYTWQRRLSNWKQ